MSTIPSSVAERGAVQIIEEAAKCVQDALAARGAQAPISYSNTVYYLPLNLGWSAQPVEVLSDLQAALGQVQAAKDLELATLLSAEVSEALRRADGCFESPFSDAQVRGWGIQLADGRMPAVAVILGSASSGPAADMLVRELRRHNVLCLLSGSIVDQLRGEGVSLNEKGIIALGDQPTSAVHAFGFIARCAMQLGGVRPGMWTEIQAFGRRRVPGFVLVLGEPGEQPRAIAQAAETFDFPTLYEARPDFDPQQARRLVHRAFAARGIQARDYQVDIPVPYSPAFEDEHITAASLQFGGQGHNAFELVQIVSPADLTDGKVEVLGPQHLNDANPSALDLGLVVKLAGPRLQADFEPYLERHIGPFLNYASGVQHTGRQDEVTVRISSEAAAHGIDLVSLGRILCQRFHQEYGHALTAVEVLLISDARELAAWQQTARAAYATRAERLASLTDSDVTEFYTCMRCRSFLPDDICIVSPERISPCGGCNWFDAKAMYELHPGGVRQPIKLGRQLDAQKGVWEGTNAYARSASHGRIQQVSMYSLMESPLGACGAFECVIMLVPEVNGVMVVSRDETSPTPVGLSIQALASLTAGDQTPGLMGVGRDYLLSSKFISAEGGFKRVVWMSSSLKESLSAELQAVCERAGEPDLLPKIADDRRVTTTAELVTWLKEHDHPALKMPKLF